MKQGRRNESHLSGSELRIVVVVENPWLSKLEQLEGLGAKQAPEA
jgi:hypothetical protein